MKQSIIITFLLFLFNFNSIAQKQVIDHNAYDGWKKIENAILSNDGRYVSYEITPHRGDGFIYLYDSEKDKLDSLPRGKGARFSHDGKLLVFKITPGFDTLRTCELDKVDKKKWPKDTLGVWLLEKDSLIKFAKIKSFDLAEKGDLLSFVSEENKLDSEQVSSEPKKKKKHICKKKKKKDTEEAYKSDGTVLTIYDPKTGQSKQFKDVTEHTISEKGEHVAIVQHKKTKTDSVYLMITDRSGNELRSFGATKSYKQLVFSPNEAWFSYYESADTAKQKQHQLHLYSFTDKTLFSIADTLSGILPERKAVSESFKPVFSENGKYFFFGSSDRVLPEEKDTLLESEKAKVDIWHYEDHRIQPQQLKELKRDERKTDLYVYHLNNGQIINVNNDTLNAYVSRFTDGEYILGSSEELYAIQNNWDMPDRKDHYRINLFTGEKELIRSEVRTGGELSPDGKSFLYFNELKGQHHIIDIESGIEKCLTCGTTGVKWQDDVNGMPMIASPYGVLGYSRDRKNILIQSEYDLWAYDLSTEKLNNLISTIGSEKRTKISLINWERDSSTIQLNGSILRGFDEITKDEVYYKFIEHGDHNDMIEIYRTAHKNVQLSKAENSDELILREMSVSEYPEVQLTNTSFEKRKQISITNPQQGNYNWANVRLIEWKSYSGIPLEGLIYTPENFDPEKKYPLMVYYYETYSENLHNHYVPKPTASIIYPTEYASSGYIVLIPDIRYKEGHPAKSAYDCIMSATDHALKLYPNIDSTRMGLQGQSWGGYQTAQLITMTNRYRAAMAGAPVSNMFSAYGGIRWGSGMNRQFQYERTQSRIGKTIWEAPELYIENSPLFHLPNVNTPLLIMHNDEDGAVPWYQGIELYTGMRRLGKPCWLLNYNGDDHNLMKNANRIDLSIRMKQFFDHYLQGQPAPLWLTEGIPALKKGKEQGYELQESH
jgi:dipeptidyl aminopeptidase/acylaminoacyl peptidase